MNSFLNISFFVGILLGFMMALTLAFIFLRNLFNKNLESEKQKWQFESDSKQKDLLLEFEKQSQKIQSDLKVIMSKNEDLIANNKNLSQALSLKTNELTETQEKLIKIESQNQHLNKTFLENQKFIEQSKQQLLDQFRSLSMDTLSQNSTSFLELAKSTFETLSVENLKNLENKKSEIQSTVNPINETLNKFELKISELEKSRIESFTTLYTHFSTIKDSQEKLRTETSNLVKALRTPHVRGRWGELQLKRVVEIAGMLEYCDFQQQTNVETEEGRLRPDLIVKLPGEKTIVVDSKAVLQSYIEFAQADNEETKKTFLLQHAKHIKDRIAELSKKNYWEQFQNSPEFVVLFLPGENFFSSALEVDPSLIELGVEQKVIIATPTTLIALLKAVSYGWKQSALTENAKEISLLGKEMYKRLHDMKEHFQKLGQQLGSSVDSYNKTMGTFETRVLVTARKFKELKSIDGNDEIEILEPIEKIPRLTQSQPQAIEDSTGE